MTKNNSQPIFSISITLTSEQQQLIQAQLASGRYTKAVSLDGTLICDSETWNRIIN